MRDKILVSLFALFCAVAVACATWDNLTVDQKVAVACTTPVGLIQPECLRIVKSCVESYDNCVAGADSNAQLFICQQRLDACKQNDTEFVACNEGIAAIGTACEATIRKDAGNVCSAFADNQERVCSQFSNSLDQSSCDRAFVAATGACILATAKSESENEAAPES